MSVVQSLLVCVLGFGMDATVFESKQASKQDPPLKQQTGYHAHAGLSFLGFCARASLKHAPYMAQAVQ